MKNNENNTKKYNEQNINGTMNWLLNSEDPNKNSYCLNMLLAFPCYFSKSENYRQTFFLLQNIFPCVNGSTCWDEDKFMMIANHPFENFDFLKKFIRYKRDAEGIYLFAKFFDDVDLMPNYNEFKDQNGPDITQE